MQQVSNEYLLQMNSAQQRHDIRGTIAGERFNKGNILKGSLTITGQISDNNEISFGNAYVSELSCTFIGITRSSWKNKVIHIEHGLWLPESATYEYVSLGYYIISGYTITKTGVTITAYDYMSKFDRPFGLSGLSGKPYDILFTLCNRKKVVLATKEADFNNLANGNTTLSLCENHDISTYRDAIGYLAAAVGCNAIMNRNGELELIPMRTADSQQYDYYVPDRCILKGSKEINEDTLSFDIITIAEDRMDKIICSDGSAGEWDDENHVYNMGSNPFLQSNDEKTALSYVKSLYDHIGPETTRTMSIKHLVPVFDLGDRVIVDYGENKIGAAITKMTYTYGDSVTLSTGADNDTSRTATTTGANGVSSQINNKSMYYYTYINADDIIINGGKKEKVFNCKAECNSDSQAEFQAEILLYAESDTLITVTYYEDGSILAYSPKETISAGYHILSLYYFLNLAASELKRFRVDITSSVGVVKINRDEARATIRGQGVAPSEFSWDGNIEIIDTYIPVSIGDDVIKNVKMSDSVQIESYIPSGANLNERYNKVLMSFDDIITVNTLSENIKISPSVVKMAYTASDFQINHYITDEWKVDTLRLSWYDTEETIEEGILKTILVNNTDYTILSLVLSLNKQYEYADFTENTYINSDMTVKMLTDTITPVTGDIDSGFMKVIDTGDKAIISLTITEV